MTGTKQQSSIPSNFARQSQIASGIGLAGLLLFTMSFGYMWYQLGAEEASLARAEGLLEAQTHTMREQIEILNKTNEGLKRISAELGNLKQNIDEQNMAIKLNQSDKALDTQKIILASINNMVKIADVLERTMPSRGF